MKKLIWLTLLAFASCGSNETTSTEPLEVNSSEVKKPLISILKVEKKTFTKGSIKEPMERLSSALSKLHSKLNIRGEISLLLDKVLNEYNVIAHMTTHGGQ